MELSVTAIRADTAGGSGGASASVASSHAIHAASRGGGTVSVPVVNCGGCPSACAALRSGTETATGGCRWPSGVDEGRVTDGTIKRGPSGEARRMRKTAHT